MEKLTLIVPVYQNKSTLRAFVERMKEVTSAVRTLKIDMLFIDDGSTDGSYQTLEEIKSEYSQLSINLIRFTRNFGQIPAIKAGLHHADSDFVAIISADLQEDPMLVVQMHKEVSKDFQVVLATRNSRKDALLTRLMSGFFYWLVRTFAIPNYPSGGFDCCLMTRRVAEELKKQAEKNTHIFVLLFWLGFPYQVVTYDRQERYAGKSQWGFWKRLKLFIDTVVGYSFAPLRFISFLGAGFSFLSFIYGGYIFTDSLLHGNPVKGWSTLVVLVTLFGGLSLLTMGILGEYLWRTLAESRSRSEYIIEKENFGKNFRVNDKAS